MNHLLIDLGNTRLKLAWAQGDGVDYLGTVDDPRAVVERVPEAPASIWLSSVADPQHTQQLVDALAAHWACPIEVVSVARYHRHLPTRYATDQLGVDRWLAMLGCRGLCQRACLVVDCGTAITLDLVAGEGVHVGGYILPGLGLMRQALLQATAIRVPEAGPSESELPTDTASAINQGAQASVVALIEKLLEQAGAEVALFIGGGDARSLSPLVSGRHDIVEQMVLLGLSRLAFLEKN